MAEGLADRAVLVEPLIRDSAADSRPDIVVPRDLKALPWRAGSALSSFWTAMALPMSRPTTAISVGWSAA